jgi:hypothetical protein
MNKNITDKTWCSLSAYAEAITNKIIYSEKLPGDINKDEIKSEVYNQFGYLINNYKPGSRSLQSYCYEYAPKRVVNELWKEYKVWNDYNKKAYVEFDDGEDFEEHHQYGKYEKDQYIGIITYLETKDLIAKIEEEAKNEDFVKVLAMMKNGMTEREIAMILDMSQSTLHRKIESFRNTLIEKGI